MMMWRNVTEKNAKDLQSFSICVALMLGLALTFDPPDILNGGAAVIRFCGVLLLVASSVALGGEIWYNYGQSEKRWMLVFTGHTLLCALFSALSAYAVLSIGPAHADALALAVLFAEAAWVHRAFIHWKSDVS